MELEEQKEEENHQPWRYAQRKDPVFHHEVACLKTHPKEQTLVLIRHRASLSPPAAHLEDSCEVWAASQFVE